MFRHMLLGSCRKAMMHLKVTLRLRCAEGLSERGFVSITICAWNDVSSSRVNGRLRSPRKQLVVSNRGIDHVPMQNSSRADESREGPLLTVTSTGYITPYVFSHWEINNHKAMDIGDKISEGWKPIGRFI